MLEHGSFSSSGVTGPVDRRENDDDRILDLSQQFEFLFIRCFRLSVLSNILLTKHENEANRPSRFVSVWRAAGTKQLSKDLRQQF